MSLDFFGALLGRKPRRLDDSAAKLQAARERHGAAAEALGNAISDLLAENDKLVERNRSKSRRRTKH